MLPHTRYGIPGPSRSQGGRHGGEYGRGSRHGRPWGAPYRREPAHWRIHAPPPYAVAVGAHTPRNRGPRAGSRGHAMPPNSVVAFGSSEHVSRRTEPLGGSRAAPGATSGVGAGDSRPPAENAEAEPVAPAGESDNNVTASDKERYDSLQKLLRQIIALEFGERCTQRSISVVITICDTLCTDAVAVVRVMEVIDRCFGEAVQSQQPQLIMHYWYIFDSLMKHFNENPRLLKAAFVAFPHLVQQYLPWHGSNIATQPWSEHERFKASYESMLDTWKVFLEEHVHEGIMKLWKTGMEGHLTSEEKSVGTPRPLEGVASGTA